MIRYTLVEFGELEWKTVAASVENVAARVENETARVENEAARVENTFITQKKHFNYEVF